MKEIPFVPKDGLDPDDFDHIDSGIPSSEEMLKRSHEMLNSYRISRPPSPVVGGWVLRDGPNCITFHMHHKPRWLTRFMMRVCFELTWEDQPDDQVLLQ